MSPGQWDDLPWHEQLSLITGLEEAGLLPDGDEEGPEEGGKVIPFEDLGIPVRQIGGR